MKLKMIMLCLMVLFVVSCKIIDDTNIVSLANGTCEEVLIAQQKCLNSGTGVDYCNAKFSSLIIAKCQNKKGE